MIKKCCETCGNYDICGLRICVTSKYIQIYDCNKSNGWQFWTDKRCWLARKLFPEDVEK